MAGTGETVTYAELDDAADRVAMGLVERDIHPGDVIATVAPSGCEWVVLAVAADRVSAVLAPISPKLAPPERAQLVELVRPALVVSDAAGVDGLVLLTAGAGGCPSSTAAP